MARILVIDNDEMVRFTLERILTNGGHTVVVAANGRDGVRLQMEAPCDLVITDVMMPEQDGIETIRILHAEFPKLPIMAIPGSGRMGNMNFLEMGKTFGAVISVARPLTPEGILGGIELARMDAAPTRH